MLLNRFIEVPATATVGGAPIDAFQADAFRQNDTLFEHLLQAILASPLTPNGADGPVSNPPAERLVQATTLTITAGHTVNLVAQVPLVWMAQDRITIDGTINANGMGAASGQDGDFGGAGGDGSTPGKACKLPVSGVAIPGDAGTKNLDIKWATRVLSCIGLCKGGASGGGATGGAGGGIILLCAPIIAINANAIIQADGAAGTGVHSGGGGGGLIILIAHQFPGGNPETNPKIHANGGAGTPTAGATPAGQAGGNGKILKIEYA